MLFIYIFWPENDVVCFLDYIIRHFPTKSNEEMPKSVIRKKRSQIKNLAVQSHTDKKERRRGNPKNMRKQITAALACMVLATAVCPAHAYATEKIQKVSVKFHIEGYDDEGYPEITAESSSGHYSVGSVDLESETTDDDDDPFTTKKSKSAAEENYVVELSADDGYAFYLTKASQVKLQGAGAEYVKASRLDNGTTLRLVIKLTDLEDVCTPISEASWNSDGVAKWETSTNAVKYQLILTRNSSSKTYFTGGTTYDFKPVMQAAGDYSLRVRPISRSGSKAEGADAGSFHVSQEQAAQYREKYAVETEKRTIEGMADTNGPGTTEIIYKNTGWKQDDRGWWYQNNDSSYVQYDWVELNGSWYFFDSDGYMVSNTTVHWGPDDYYCGEDGKMVKNATVPDGRKAGEDGVLVGKIKDSSKTNGISGDEEDYSNSGPAFAKKTDDATGPASEQ